ncbi:MAG: nuclear transport factor 2 family protein [Bacteroidota bacterium]|jgi:ketosteroid isomerase-like protein
MNTAVRFLLVVWFMTPAAAQQSMLSGSNGDFQLKIVEWKNAYNSADTALLSSFYSEDTYYVSPHVPDLMIHGRDNLMKNFYRGYVTGGRIHSIDIVSGTFSADMASLICIYRAANSGISVSGRNVIIFKKVNGVWKIITHASII